MTEVIQIQELYTTQKTLEKLIRWAKENGDGRRHSKYGQVLDEINYLITSAEQLVKG